MLASPSASAANFASAPPCVAIEIGGTKLQLAVGTSAGEILDRQRFAVDPAAGAAGIREEIAAALPGIVAQWRPAAIGVGYGGPVDRRTGHVVKSHHVSGWEGFPLGEWLADIAGLPVAVDNDANVAALGEALHGAGRGCDPVFYVTLGSGVGGGLVCGGRIFHGAGMGEAEIGHLRLGPAGEITEYYCSGWSLDRRIREAAAKAPASPLARLVQASPGQGAHHLGPALAAGDPLAAEILDGAAEKLALALSHVGHLCHPQVIVLGGGVALLGEPLRQAVATHLGRFMMEALRPGPRVALTTLREDAVPVGAIALAFQQFPALVS
jgi:glucokinase